MQIKNSIKDAALLVGITFVILLLGELSLRLIYPEKIFTQPQNPAFEFNPHYLSALRPNIEKTYIRSEANGGDEIVWRTNSDAFRGNELIPNADKRIIVYGDSNIHARFSTDDNTYPGKLSSFLNDDASAEIEVVNAGIVGFGPDQSVLRLEKEFEQFNPDLIVLHVLAGNDYGDIIRNRLFELNDSNQLIETGFRDPNIFESVGFINSLLTVSATLSVSASISQMLTPRTEAEQMDDLLELFAHNEFDVYATGRERKYSVFSDHYDIDLAKDPSSYASKTKIKLMELLLTRANNFAKSKGVPLVLLIQPSIVDMTTTRSVINYDFLQQFPEYRTSNLVAPIEQTALKENISHINLFSTFLEQDPEDLFFTDGNDHWNDAGQELAARATATYILEHHLLDE